MLAAAPGQPVVVPLRQTAALDRRRHGSPCRTVPSGRRSGRAWPTRRRRPGTPRRPRPRGPSSGARRRGSSLVVHRARPSVRPCTRGLARTPARPSSRSRMRSRSNSASAPNTWKTSLPVGLVVSTPSVSERNPTPRSRSSSTRPTRSLSERPKRSSRQTTSVSPERANARASVSPGRSVFAPLASSVKVFSHPASRSASSWRSSLWSEVETRGVADEHGGGLKS